MSSIFNTLNIGYSGLAASQVGVNTTSHNITNAESDGYTRQRVITAAATPVYSAPGNVGNGTQIIQKQMIKLVTSNADGFLIDGAGMLLIEIVREKL